ncbi:hypothetical protein ACA910_021995 [Epithemia clementina (nom. ined.)]
MEFFWLLGLLEHLTGLSATDHHAKLRLWSASTRLHQMLLVDEPKDNRHFVTSNYDDRRHQSHKTGEPPPLSWHPPHASLMSVCDQAYQSLQSEFGISPQLQQACTRALLQDHVNDEKRARQGGGRHNNYNYNNDLDREEYAKLVYRVKALEAASVSESQVPCEALPFERLEQSWQDLFWDLANEVHGGYIILSNLSDEVVVVAQSWCRRLLVATAVDRLQRHTPPRMETDLKNEHTELATNIPDWPSESVVSWRPVPAPMPHHGGGNGHNRRDYYDRKLQGTNAPTINDADFGDCRFDLFTSNRNCCPRDNHISPNEFIFVLNARFGLNLPEDSAFSSLHILYQQAYTTISQGNELGPDITGSIPNTAPTTSPAQMENLRLICSELSRANNAVQEAVVVGPLPTQAPVTAPPVSSRSPQPTATLLFRNTCNVAVLRTEDDVPGLDSMEYVQVIRVLTGDASLGVPSFQVLPAPLKVPFTVYGTATIPVQGSQGLRSPALDLFCDRVDAAIQQYLDPQPTLAPTEVVLDPPTRNNAPSTPAPAPVGPPAVENPRQACFDSLVQADSDQSGTLDETEYLGFVRSIDGAVVAADAAFPNAPYIVRDNYQWILGVDQDQKAVDLTAAAQNSTNTSSALLSQETLLAAACQRTRTIVAAAVAGNNAVTLPEHCWAALTTADANNDDQLNESEFVVFVQRFVGLVLVAAAPEGEETAFPDLDAKFQTLFASHMGEDGTTKELDISGAKPDQTPSQDQVSALNAFCSEMEATVANVRSSTVLLEKCRLAVEAANGDDDNSITPNEFVIFIYTMADVASNGVSFTSLGEDIQNSFPTISSALQEIDLKTWVEDDDGGGGGGGTLTDSQKNTTEAACQQALQLSKAISSPNSVQSATASIYSSFAFSNDQGLVASDLVPTNPNRQNLESSFDLFVKAEIARFTTTASPNLRRRRRLQVVGVIEGSPELYIFEDWLCPGQSSRTNNNGGSTTKCQTAYGRFNLNYQRTDENSANALINQVTSALVQALRNGQLQSALDQVNPSSPITIIGPGAQLVPTSAPDDGVNTLLVAIIISVLMLVLLCGVVIIAYFVFQPTLHRKLSTWAAGERKETTNNNAGYNNNSSKQLQFQQQPNNPSKRVQFQMNNNNNNNNNNSNQGSQREQAPVGSYRPGSNRQVAGQNPWSPTTEAEAANNNRRPPPGSIQSSSVSGYGGGGGGVNPRPVPNNNRPNATSDVSSNPRLVQEQNNKERPPTGPVMDKPVGKARPVPKNNRPNATSDGSSNPRLVQEQNIKERPPTGPVMDKPVGKAQALAQAPPTEPPSDGSESILEEFVDEEESYEEEMVDDDDDDNDEKDAQEDPKDHNKSFDDSTFDEDERTRSSGENTTATADRQKQYRETVEALILEVIPDEIEHLDVMMEQFTGREEELISTLRNMATVSSSEDEEGESNEGNGWGDESGQSGSADDDDDDDEFEEGSDADFSGSYSDEDEEESSEVDDRDDDELVELDSFSEYDDS